MNEIQMKQKFLLLASATMVLGFAGLTYLPPETRDAADALGIFLPDSFRPDNLHPVAKGYDIWGEAVKDKLAELMKQD